MKKKHHFHIRNNEHLAIPEIMSEKDTEKNIEIDDVSDHEFIIENVALPEYHPRKHHKKHHK